MFVLEARYVMALLSAAPSSDIADQIGEDLWEFAQVMQEDKILRNFMLNPAISSKIKRDTIGKIFTEDTPGILKNFITLLVDKGRLKFLPGICMEYKRLKAEIRGVIIIKVFSSAGLDEEQLEGIRNLYMKKYDSAAAEIEQKSDPALLGNVLIQIGDFCIDSSLLNRINGIHKNIANAHIGKLA